MDGSRFRRLIWYAIGAMWLIMLVQYMRASDAARMPYSQFKAELAAGNVAEVSISSRLIAGKLKPEAGKPARSFESVRVEGDPDLVRELEQHNVKMSGVPDSGFLRTALSWMLPLAILLGASFFLIRRLGRQGGMMAVARNKAKMYVEKDVKVSFNDVAGVNEAKDELTEVIEFLKTPDKFRRLGGKLPKGVLLVGPPGTGKTLLAKAVAGEAGVPFFSISGSEFVEMFVGVGAARVRDLFQQAKKMAPCIVFIDELDALGKARGTGPMGHDEREQTLNQLLVELDGFDARIGVILIGATNRPEILDPALLRAGRFDRHVTVDRPDKQGRLAILKVHARDVKLADQRELDAIAGMTAGMVGADLANIINEGALLAVRRGKQAVDHRDLDEAVERVIAGLEKKNRVLSRAEKERVAHHELGHALMAMSLPGLDPVRKISIIPRGIAALGYTLQVPTEDRFLMTESELQAKIAVLLGGRVAEELVYQEASTGAQDDLTKATEIARSMVKSYGLSKTLGLVSFDPQRRPLLMELAQPSLRGDYSEQISRQIDAEIRRILDEQHARVTAVLSEQLELLRRAAQALLAKETLSGDELIALMDQFRREALAPQPATVH